MPHTTVFGKGGYGTRILSCVTNVYENSGCQYIVIHTATSLGSWLYKRCGFKPTHQHILEHMCSSAKNNKKHFSARPYRQEARVHIVFSSRMCKSTLRALVSANVFVKNTVIPCICGQGPSKRSRCNEVFNSSNPAASTVAAPGAVLRPFPCDVIVEQHGIMLHTGNIYLDGILGGDF